MILLPLLLVTADATAIDALTLGAEAERARNARALMKAAVMLEASGARPQPGEADLAKDWRALASKLGAKPPRALLYRGRTLGPAYRRGQLGAGAGTVLEQTFSAGQRAQVSLVSGRGAALSLRIADDEGAERCARKLDKARAECAWLPVWTARHRIELRNLGHATVSYFLLTN